MTERKGMAMDYFAGIDVGSMTCKVALSDEKGFVAGASAGSGTNYRKSATDLLDRVLEERGLARGEVRAVAATGVGASQIGYADASFGEVLAVARGAAAADKRVRTVIDVGCQATRVVWLDEEGRVTHFSANEKCATGSGRFLQVVANVLRVRLEEVGELSLLSRNPVSFTTGCAVFGESEAITRVSEGVPREDILAGVHRSLAEKIGGLLRTRGIAMECALCGGGALDAGLVSQLERQLGVSLAIFPRPQLIGALGASVLARQHAGANALQGRKISPRGPALSPRTLRPRPKPVEMPVLRMEPVLAEKTNENKDKGSKRAPREGEVE